jgi:sugar/nucleoside kinase (ribokinase family)
MKSDGSQHETRRRTRHGDLTCPKSAGGMEAWNSRRAHGIVTAMTPPAPALLCIGAVCWDIIGRVETPLPPGADLPGRITRLPGGVALNTARALRQLGHAPTLLTAIGGDADGDELLAACRRLGLDMEHVHRASGRPTDRYLAIEDAGGLVAAIADARALEEAGAQILAPLRDGRLGCPARPWAGAIVLDGNLTAELLAEVAASPCFAAADLRVVSASIGKVDRLRALLGHARATFYLNREEAGALCGERFPDAPAAAQALLARGARRVLVTDGARAGADAQAGAALLTAEPPRVRPRRVTGAGDTFMAAHFAAEHRGATRSAALTTALAAASRFVAEDIGS